MMKKVVWSLIIVVALGGLAYPKLKPWLMSELSKFQGAEGDTKTAVATSDRAKKDDASASKDGAVKKSKDAGDKPKPPLKVSTVMVKPSVFVETINSTGTVLADEGVDLQPEINGKIVSINFVEGSPVKKGDLLLKLNDADLRANLDRYNYSKKLAEVRYRRYAQLLAQKMVSQDDYDSVLSELNVQQSFIDLYKAQIEKTEIRAPFDGVIGLRYVSVGAFVNALTRIATLQRLEELKIDFAVPEKYAGRIKVGGQITFTVAGGLQQYAGRIAALDPRIDSGTRTLLVRAVCANTDGRLLPGAFTNVSIPLNQIADALLIPAEAVVAGLDEKNVYVIKDGLAERRAVETGSRTSTEVHILSGLKAGDQVITSGLQQMRAKLPVESLHDNRSNKSEMEKASGDGHGASKPQGSTSWLPTKSQPLNPTARLTLGAQELTGQVTL